MKYVRKKNKNEFLLNKEEEQLYFKNKLTERKISTHHEKKSRSLCYINQFKLNPILNIPNIIQNHIDKIKLKYVSPQENIEGNYQEYLNEILPSIKLYKIINFNLIFSNENKVFNSYCKFNSKNNDKKLLILDLDETLIYSDFSKCPEINEKEVSKHISIFLQDELIKPTFIEVYLRPGIENFLIEMDKFFDLAIFTAACKNYADKIINIFDPQNKFFKFRLYRESCINLQNIIYIKDLRIIENFKPESTILVDNSLFSFSNNITNGILVNSFYGNKNDNQLKNLSNYLKKNIIPADDVRDVIDKTFNFTKMLQKY
jgi:CTD small phosphatase-like protein 2